MLTRMLSLNKLSHKVNVIRQWRLAVSFQTAEISSKNFEDRLGLPPIPEKVRKPYDRFCVETRLKLLKENPNLKRTEAKKLCAKKWAELDENIKFKMRQEFFLDQNAYQQKLYEYNSQLTEEQKSSIEDKINAVENRLKLEDDKRIVKQQLCDMERPKQPATAFNRFFQEIFSKDEGETLTKVSSILKTCSKQWQEMPEEEKAVYENAYKADISVYRKELTKWEKKMIDAGHFHLVRQASLTEYARSIRCQSVKDLGKTPIRKRKSKKDFKTEPS